MVGRVSLVGREMPEKKKSWEPPSASGSEDVRRCGVKRVVSGLGRVVRTRPTEADGDEAVRGNRRTKFAEAGLTRPTS